MCGPLVLRLLCIFCVCIYVSMYLCVPTLIMCAIITSCTLLPGDFTLVLLYFGRLLSVAIMSSLAQLQVRDGYREAEAMWTWRRETDREWKHQKQAATCDAYRVANQQRMAARRALEWIGMSKAWLVFRYEISEFFLQLNTWLPNGCATIVMCARISWCPERWLGWNWPPWPMTMALVQPIFTTGQNSDVVQLATTCIGWVYTQVVFVQQF